MEGLGIQIGIKDHRLTVIAPIEDTPAFAAGIQSGDTIIQVDETPTKDLTLMEAVQHMRGPRGTSVKLTVLREGLEEPLIFTITRDIIKIQSVRSKLLEGNVGYVRLSQFQEASAEDLTKELENIYRQKSSRLDLGSTEQSWWLADRRRRGLRTIFGSRPLGCLYPRS